MFCIAYLMCIIYYLKGSPEWKQNPSGAVTRPSSNTRSDNSTRFRHAKSPQQGTYIEHLLKNDLIVSDHAGE